MARKIENIPTSEINAYIQSADVVINKCNQILESSRTLPKSKELEKDLTSVLKVRSEHFNLVMNLQSELEKRMAKHFSLRNGAYKLSNIANRVRELITSEESKLEKESVSLDDVEESVKSNMKVLK